MSDSRLSLTHSHSHSHSYQPTSITTMSSKFIVVFKANTSENEITKAIEDVKSQGGKVTHRYDSSLLGFSAELPTNVYSTLESHPQVDYVEPDGEVSIQ
ncbi:unnamed protein product [Mortierella alpina]